MIKIRQTLPDVDALKNRLNVVFKNGEEIIKNTQNTRDEFNKNRRRAITSLIFFAVSMFIVAPLPFLLDDVPAIFLSLLVVAIGIVSFIFTKRWFVEQETLAQEINMALISIIIECFDRQALYTHDKANLASVKEILTKSELLTERIDMVAADDTFIFFEPFKTTVRELAATRTEQRGKSSVNVTVFKGVFVEVELNKTLEGVTFISTEGNKSGFGHIGFFSSVLGLGNIKETKLEWNQFEKDLHVATDNEVEARYILTPNFMEDLHNWWSEEKENIRIVFRDGKMLMLLPDRGVQIGRSTSSDKTEDLKDYAFTMIKPLWRTLSLIEDVKL